MITIHRATVISLTAMTIVVAAATGNAFSQEQADQAAASKTGAGSTAAEAPHGPRSSSRSRADVKAEAVKANNEHRTTLSESMDLMKKTDDREGDKARSGKKKNVK